MSKANRELFFDWLAESQRIDFPATGSEERRMLAADDCRVRKMTTFRDAIRFLVWAMAEHGNYGTRMYATQATLAEGFGCSPKTVRRYLRAGEILGLISVVRPSDRYAGISTEYDIRDFWSQAWTIPPEWSASGQSQAPDPWAHERNESPPY